MITAAVRFEGATRERCSVGIRRSRILIEPSANFAAIRLVHTGLFGREKLYSRLEP